MNRMDDDKGRFYLNNQSLIDEWRAIGNDLVPAELDRFMRSCSKPVEDLAAEVGASLWTSLDVQWRKLFVVRPEWKLADGVPRVAVGLQWRYGSAGFVSG